MRIYKAQQEYYVGGDQQYLYGGFVPEINLTPQPSPPLVTPTTTPTNTITPTLTRTPTTTPSNTPTISITPSITPSTTPNAVCAERFVITNSTDVNNANGTYNRLWAYSGGTMLYGYWKGYAQIGTAPDGNNYPVFKEASSNKFFFRTFVGVGNIDLGWATTSNLSGNPWQTTGAGGVINPGYFGQIVISGVRYPVSGLNDDGGSTFYLTYSNPCPTPTPTPTPTITPSNTPTQSIVVYSYLGRTTPDQASGALACSNYLTARGYSSNKPLASLTIGDYLYDSYPTSPTNGGNNWIALKVGGVGQGYAFQVATDGEILDTYTC